MIEIISVYVRVSYGVPPIEMSTNGTFANYGLVVNLKETEIITTIHAQ